jgi:hypothetical protein
MVDHSSALKSAFRVIWVLSAARDIQDRPTDVNQKQVSLGPEIGEEQDLRRSGFRQLHRVSSRDGLI